MVGTRAREEKLVSNRNSVSAMPEELLVRRAAHGGGSHKSTVPQPFSCR